MAGKGFGLQPDTGKKAQRRYVLTDRDWLDLFVFMYMCVINGANPSIYQSGDGSALCLSVRHGKTGAKYWIGPDDSATDIIVGAYNAWNVQMDLENPLDNAISRGIEQEAAYLKSKYPDEGSGTR